ncbi:MAG: hypothetical protein EPN97_00455 [Alphaproteobacteria bacterium]|nr:MAG: hypothetical protein EPN97_00455 [Alphaproteobacteria bacterium]
MTMSFENLYMSQSLHDLFNKSTVLSPEDTAALDIGGPAVNAPSPGDFTLEAMIAAADSYSVSAFDLTRYVSDL